MNPLVGKSALVTGGGTGIGWGIARALAGAGAHVAIVGRRADVLAKTAATWDGPGKMSCHPVDVGDRPSVSALFQWFTKTIGRLDILVNCAGINTKTRLMGDITPEQWDHVMNINSTGVFNCMREALPAMRERGDGLIVNISSTSGKRAGLLGGVAYNASKFAVTALSTAAAIEEGRKGIRVSTVFPGEVDTPILEHRPQPVSAERRATMLQPEDVGAMVLAIALLPPHAHVPELIIKPLVQEYC